MRNLKSSISFIRLSVAFSIATFCRICPAQDNDDQARQKYTEGVSLFDQGQYADAATAFREANRLKPSWKILFNIGQSEAAAGRFGLALEAFERYLAEGRDDIDIERKDYVIKEIERLRVMAGKVDVRAPDGSMVVIDGVERGSAPFSVPLLVTSGKEQEVVVLLDGKEILRRKVVVFGGQTAVVEAAIKEEPKQEPKQEPAPVAAPIQKPVEPKPVDQPPKEEKPEGLDQTWFWVGLGATAAFGAGTIAFNFVAADKKDEFDKNRSNANLKDETETYQAVGIGFLAATCAAAVATGILAIFTDWGGDDESQGGSSTPADSHSSNLSVIPMVAPSAGALGIMGRF